MATAAIASPKLAPKLKSRPIIADKLNPISEITPKTFDPGSHLNFQHEPKTLSMADIGLGGVGISPVAVSDPFPLFSQEAIQHMRSEIFTQEVWENCLFSTEFAGCQLRGHCPKYAPFMTAAWKHPQTLAIVSKIAGIDLVPVFDYEIGNINVSVNNAETDKRTSDNADGDVPVTKWHYDSYPFVCVVMMSDASKMLGGETAVKTGSGTIMKIRGPQMGCAVVLQGRYISHQALAAHGGSERITMITAYRPRDTLINHTSVLTTIRPISDLQEVYYQWTRYRTEVAMGQMKGLIKDIDDDYCAGRATDKDRIKRLLTETAAWLTSTTEEMK